MCSVRWGGVRCIWDEVRWCEVRWLCVIVCGVWGEVEVRWMWRDVRWCEVLCGEVWWLCVGWMNQFACIWSYIYIYIDCRGWSLHAVRFSLWNTPSLWSTPSWWSHGCRPDGLIFLFKHICVRRLLLEFGACLVPLRCELPFRCEERVCVMWGEVWWGDVRWGEVIVGHCMWGVRCPVLGRKGNVSLP